MLTIVRNHSAEDLNRLGVACASQTAIAHISNEATPRPYLAAW
jgi:hypothetical protein